jgi:hypothetical protein
MISSLTGLTGPVEADAEGPATGSLHIGNRNIGNRQLAAVLFVVIVLVGMIATAAYLAGRVAVDGGTSVARTRSTSTAVPPATVSKPAAAKPVAPAAAAALPVLQGRFLQVGAVDKGMAEVAVEYLARKGFSARIGDSPSPGIVRVLVGPIGPSQDPAKLQAEVEVLGFRPFLRQY